ncbi:MAG: family 20 glycosylhydrolase [Bacteroidetes bacterium]|nr:family 20 glycosylhydrolase [Bacteroidota bacterium]
MKIAKGILVTFFFPVIFFSQAQTATSVSNLFPLIPKPVSFKASEGKFPLSNKTIIVADSSSIPDVEIFNLQLEKIYGFSLPVFLPGQHVHEDGVISVSRQTKQLIPKDGYELSVHQKLISLNGKDAGVFYGFQTLLQLIIPGMEKTDSIPCCEVKDSPRFPWRGMHLDVCRHFFSKEFIKKYIDLIALYKMNTFHWHLTDDQGWRIEIKKYPKLIETGSWRNGSMVGAYSNGQFDSIRYGGYYSQDDIREVVAYAMQRHVTIVPEIEMPGHSLAALASYPELSCTGGPFEVAKAWGVFDDVYCPKEETFQFVENVLSEVCDLFPGKYIHVGGDECAKVRWKNCEHCQKLMKEKKLKDENQLQSYFIRRLERYLHSKGKQLIGWDEILEGGLAPGVTVMSWRGTEGGIIAAKQHHDVVMTPGSHCYFDYYQGSPDYEPLGIGGYTTVEKVYSYEPVPAELSSENKKYILGAQGNVWTEYIQTPSQVEYMALPRMCALAEVLWSPKEMKKYSEFQNRLIRHFSLLDKLNVNYAKTIYELKTSVKPLENGNGISFGLTSPFTSGNIFYTMDGSDPAAESVLYTQPVSIVKSCKVKAAYFEDGQRKGNTLSQEFFVSKSTGKKIKLNIPPHENYFCNGPQSLVDGIKGDLHKHGQNWLGWWGKDMVAEIDLGKKETFSKISLDVYDGEASWIYLPVSIEILISDDGDQFSSIKKLSSEEIKKFNGAIEIQTGNQSARFVKVIAKNAGKIPDGKQGSGNDAWLFVDEISVE